MAASLAAHVVSDLCIGKPPVISIPSFVTVADALVALRCNGEPYLFVSDESCLPAGKPRSFLGKVSAVDALCFLCSEPHLADPFSALSSPVSAILQPNSAALLRYIDPRSSVVEALELFLDGAQNLLVPIRNPRRKHTPAAATPSSASFCCLTQEDLARFFLGSIALFSPIPALPLSTLGLIRPDVHAVACHSPTLAATPLIAEAAASQTAVAVLAPDGRLAGEISSTAIALCRGGWNGLVAAAVAVLTAGEFVAYIDCGGDLPGYAVRAVKARLLASGMKGMLELMELQEEEEEDYGRSPTSLEAFSSSSSLSTTSSLSSSSSDEEESSTSSEPAVTRWRREATVGLRRYGSYSARMGNRSEDAIVCHPGSSLVAVMMQALAHRVYHVWVVDDEHRLAGIVTLPDLLLVFRELLEQ